MTTMKNATSTEAPNLTLDQFPKVCHSAMRRIQSVVEQERPKHVVCWGPMHPWVYAALSVMDGGRIDAIYQAKEFKDGDMVVVQDILLTNVKRNQARSPLGLSPTSLEVHVRDRAEEVVLHDDTFRWGRADMLIFSQHMKSKVPFHEIFKTRRPDWTFNNVLCVIPNSPVHDVDDAYAWCAIDEAEAMASLGYEEERFLPAREDSFGITHFQPTQL